MELKRRVLARLKTHAEAQGWDPEEAKSLLIACPLLLKPDDPRQKMTASYVVEAVREFFNMPDAPVKEENAFGFIVYRTSGIVKWLPMQVIPKDERRYPWYDEYSHVLETTVESWDFITVVKRLIVILEGSSVSGEQGDIRSPA